jgi:RES domain-containing protein
MVSARTAGCDQCERHRVHVTVEEVCERLRLTTPEARRVVRSYCCPHCDAGPRTYGDLAELEPNELAHIQRSERWDRRHGARLRALIDYLERTPGLGLMHPAGAALRKAVMGARVTTLRDARWWRGCPFSNQPTKPGPARLLFGDAHRHPITVGRFNHAGQPTLYLSDDVDTVAAELCRGTSGQLWVAGIAFQRPLRVIDLSVTILGEPIPQDELIFAGLGVSDEKTADDHNPREYVLTRFIADLVRRRPSVDGVLFTSSVRRPWAKNLVVVREDCPVRVSVAPELFRWDWVTMDASFGGGSQMQAIPAGSAP